MLTTPCSSETIDLVSSFFNSPSILECVAYMQYHLDGNVNVGLPYISQEIVLSDLWKIEFPIYSDGLVTM